MNLLKIISKGECLCHVGFSGDSCEITPCSGIDCKYGGSCLVDGSSYNVSILI